MAEKHLPNTKRLKYRKFYVGLLLIVKFDEGNGSAAIIRRKGERDKMGRRLPWPDSFTLTVHTQCKRGEKHKDVLEQALYDQLGLASIISHLEITRLVKMKRRDKDTDEPHIVTNYFIAIPYAAVAKAIEGVISGFRFIAEDECLQIRNIEDFDKTDRIPDGIIAMFPDEVETLRRAFNQV